MAYSFICKECKKIFEIAGSFDTVAGLEKKCPNCGSLKINRKFYPAISIFKTNGFYKTDNKK